MSLLFFKFSAITLRPLLLKPSLFIRDLSSKNKFLQEIKSKYGAVTIGFSGWAQSKKFSFGRRADYSVTMSDHCDFNELVNMVIESGAEQVYTNHGFVNEFAAHLNKLGIDAQPLVKNSLDDFI